LAEKNQILTEWNATEENYPRTKCIHELFEAQVEKNPDTVAVVIDDEVLTYAELNDRANQVAHHLQGLGVSIETLVGIYIERSVEMVVGLLGILKAGGTYVPLDPAYPKERLMQMILDAHMSVIVTQKKLATELPPSSAKLLMLDNLSAWLFTDPQPQHINGSSETLAYVIYTSGSTGKPKGVQISHRAVVNLLTSVANTTGFTEKDNLLAVTTFSFDIAALDRESGNRRRRNPACRVDQLDKSHRHASDSGNMAFVDRGRLERKLQAENLLRRRSVDAHFG
jgi:non-ribosomal peptide synthetase component F